MATNKVQYGDKVLIDLTSDTILASNVEQGVLFHDKYGIQQTGTMPIIEASDHTLDCGEQYVIPQGLHDGQGTVTANSLASQTPATATEDDIYEGKTAWVNGELVTGVATFTTLYEIPVNPHDPENYNVYVITTDGNETTAEFAYSDEPEPEPSEEPSEETPEESNESSEETTEESPEEEG